MAGDSGIDESQFKGFQKYFNSYTLRGRNNIANVTLSALGLTGLYFYLKPKKKPAAPEQKK